MYYTFPGHRPAYTILKGATLGMIVVASVWMEIVSNPTVSLLLMVLESDCIPKMALFTIITVEASFSLTRTGRRG